MKENAQILLRMLTEFHRQVQDSLGERGKPTLLLGNPVVRTFNVYLEKIKEMFPDSFVAKLSPVEPVPGLGEAELAPDELEKRHLSKAHEVSIASSQIIEYLRGMVNGEAGATKATRGLPEIFAILNTLRDETEEIQFVDTKNGKSIAEMLVDKYNNCLSVCLETVGQNDEILSRLFKPIEQAVDELSYAAKIHEVKISASGLHAYLEAVEEQEEHTSMWGELTILQTRIEDWMRTKDHYIHSQLEKARQEVDETKEQLFQKIDEQIENVEVQFEERVQQLNERLDEMNQRADELKERFYNTMDEKIDRIHELHDELNRRLDELSENLNEKTNEFSEERGHLEKQMDERIVELDERFDELNERLDELSKVVLKGLTR